MSRYMPSVEGLRTVARTVANLDTCPTCLGDRQILERDPDDDTNPSSVVEVQCPDCATESGLAYREQPSPRERHLHAASDGPLVAIGEFCDCGARETGAKGPSHRYICPRYAPNREAA